MKSLLSSVSPITHRPGKENPRTNSLPLLALALVIIARRRKDDLAQEKR